MTEYTHIALRLVFVVVVVFLLFFFLKSALGLNTTIPASLTIENDSVIFEKDNLR